MVRAARPGPAPGRGSFTPEVTLTRKQYRRVAVGLGGGETGWRGEKEGGRAGSAGQRRGLTGEGQRTPPPAKTRVRIGMGVGEGSPSRAREPHTLTCPSPSPPARRRLPADAGCARTQDARTRAAGRFLEPALRRVSPNPARSKLCACSVSVAAAATQLP